MRKLMHDTIVTLSAELSTLNSDENHKRTTNLAKCLNDLGITYNFAIGCYKHRLETVIVALPKDKAELLCLKTLGLVSFKQESVLVQQPNGESYLHYSDKEEHLGKIRAIPKVMARKLDSYTLLDDIYYGII